MKYSKNFERDYNCYLNNKKEFVFYGTGYPKFKAHPDGKLSAKEVFYMIDSRGINVPTSEPELLNEILSCKASINFHIKMWSEGRADATMPYFELLEIQKEFNLPWWVVEATEKQKLKKLEESRKG